jgi:putative nucleotidyltransferase with HDIG domain
VVLLLLAGLAFWFEIPIEPYGSLNLSPVVVLVTTSGYGLSSGLLVAALAPMTRLLIRRLIGSPPIAIGRILVTGGEAALALWIGFRMSSLVVSTESQGQLVSLMSLSGVTLAATFMLIAIRVALEESISFRRLLRPLARRVIPHFLAMMAAMPIVWLTYALLGPLGIVLSMVVMVETYYPWKLLGEQRDLFLKSLQMFSNAVDVKDPYTAHHSKRVAQYAVRLARLLGAPEDEVNRIRIGALMHDIGKIAVPGNIIRKPAKLTDDEMALMKRHVGAGASLIEGLEILEDSRDIIQSHHENYDGTGYPAKLAGAEIPLGSRIVFVADAYDALTTDRPYRKGKTRSEAVAILTANAGSQFDPSVVEALKTILGKDY